MPRRSKYPGEARKTTGFNVRAPNMYYKYGIVGSRDNIAAASFDPYSGISVIKWSKSLKKFIWGGLNIRKK